MTTATRIATAWPRFSGPLTKAGGLVVRPARARHEVLMVTSISRPGRWTLPKGTLENGEHPVDTATREIAEEAGVLATPVRPLGVVARDDQRIAFYLFRFRHDVAWLEDGIRERQWVDLDDAERHLRQADLHRVIAAARRVLAAR